jgi:hypothetical protein
VINPTQFMNDLIATVTQKMNDSGLVHSFVSGAVLVVPVLILNLICSQIFLQTMRAQNSAMQDSAKEE